MSPALKSPQQPCPAHGHASLCSSKHCPGLKAKQTCLEEHASTQPGASRAECYWEPQDWGLTVYWNKLVCKRACHPPESCSWLADGHRPRLASLPGWSSVPACGGEAGTPRPRAGLQLGSGPCGGGMHLGRRVGRGQNAGTSPGVAPWGWGQCWGLWLCCWWQLWCPLVTAVSDSQ